MRKTQGGGAEYSIHYLAAVSGVTVLVAVLAWIGQNRSMAMAAAVLGLYALHILSVRVLLEGQKRQQGALQAQWELLQKLVAPDEIESDAGELAVPIPTTPARRAGDGREAPEVEVAAVGATATDSRPAAQVPALDVPSEWLSDPEVEIVMPPVARDANGTGDREGPQDGDPSIPDVVAAHPAPYGHREPAAGDRATPSRPHGGVEIPIPRHFALGTVALIRDLLTPAEVARILLEQREQPEKKFATLAVEMGLLTAAEREELLLAQAEGLFTDAEMREARERLRQFRESTARALSELS